MVLNLPLNHNHRLYNAPLTPHHLHLFFPPKGVLITNSFHSLLIDTFNLFTNLLDINECIAPKYNKA